MGLPVVVIRGLKDGGKTTFIEDSLVNGDFGDVGRTLVLSLESGEARYDEAKLKKYGVTVETIESKEDFSGKALNEIIHKDRPQVVFVEASEEYFEDLQMPPYFDVQQTMAIIDGSTFSSLFNEQRQKFVNIIKGSDVAVINRCEPTEETSEIKHNVKMVNTNIAVIALGKNGEQLKLESDLPFSLKNDPITLTLDDFGAFYIDSFESKDRYDGRMIEFDCMACFSKKLPPKSFVAGRLAMTCCVNDIQLIGHLCAYKQDINLKNQSWIHLKAIIHYMKFRGSKEEQVVLQAVDIKEIPAPDEEKAVLTLNSGN